MLPSLKNLISVSSSVYFLSFTSLCVLIALVKSIGLEKVRPLAVFVSVGGERGVAALSGRPPDCGGGGQ